MGNSRIKVYIVVLQYEQKMAREHHFVCGATWVSATKFPLQLVPYLHPGLYIILSLSCKTLHLQHVRL